MGNNRNRRRPYFNKKHKKQSQTPAEVELDKSAVDMPEPDAELMIDDDILDSPTVSVSITTDDTPKIPVAGIRFKANGKVYFFDKKEFKLEDGGFVIVETARGPEFGEVAFSERAVSESSLVLPLRPVIRIATDADLKHHEENKKKEEVV